MSQYNNVSGVDKLSVSTHRKRRSFSPSKIEFSKVYDEDIYQANTKEKKCRIDPLNL